jgi:WD40 repeat protein
MPRISLLGFGPDGSTLWGLEEAGYDVSGQTVLHSLVRLDGRTGEIVSRVRLGEYWWFVLSPDGTQVAALDVAGHVDVWDIAGPAKLFSVTGTPFGIGLAFSPDGHFLALNSGNDEVVLLDARTGRRVGRPLSGPLGLFPVDFDASATLLVTAGSNGDVQLWDVASRQQIAAIPPSTSKDVFRVPILSPDGRQIAIMAASGQHDIWDVDPADWKGRACAVAGRNLTRSEWQQFLPDRPYQPVCPT